MSQSFASRRALVNAVPFFLKRGLLLWGGVRAPSGGMVAVVGGFHRVRSLDLHPGSCTVRLVALAKSTELSHAFHLYHEGDDHSSTCRIVTLQEFSGSSSQKRTWYMLSTIRVLHLCPHFLLLLGFSVEKQ